MYQTPGTADQKKYKEEKSASPLASGRRSGRRSIPFTNMHSDMQNNGVI